MKKDSDNLYEVLLTIGSDIVSSETSDLAGFLRDYRGTPVKGKVILKVRRGENQIDRVLFVHQARKIFNNDLASEIFARNIERSLI